MDLPIENKRLRDLIELKSNGVQLDFASEIGVSLTHVNRFFRVDARSGKIPSILKSKSVLRAINKKYPEITRDYFHGSGKENDVSEYDIFALEVINRHDNLMQHSKIYKGHIEGLMYKAILDNLGSEEKFIEFLKSKSLRGM